MNKHRKRQVDLGTLEEMQGIIPKVSLSIYNLFLLRSTQTTSLSIPEPLFINPSYKPDTNQIKAD